MILLLFSWIEENFEELDVGMKLLSPWYNSNNTSDWVRLTKAIFVEEKKENG